MAAATSKVVWFVIPDEPDGLAPHFAVRRCGQYWCANAFRGFRLTALQSRRFPPQLVGGDGRRIPVEILSVEEVTTAA